jgi:uncharacterized membrane protein YeaQ/YmgE (transglycosylase-associated protein family)
MITAIIFWIIVGLIAGALAKFVMPGDDPGGIVVTIILGIVGGGRWWLAPEFYWPRRGGWLDSVHHSGLHWGRDSAIHLSHVRGREPRAEARLGFHLLTGAGLTGSAPAHP